MRKCRTKGEGVLQVTIVVSTHIELVRKRVWWWTHTDWCQKGRKMVFQAVVKSKG